MISILIITLIAVVAIGIGIAVYDPTRTRRDQEIRRDPASRNNAQSSLNAH